jgi:hypothetical protein
MCEGRCRSKTKSGTRDVRKMSKKRGKRSQKTFEDDEENRNSRIWAG